MKSTEQHVRELLARQANVVSSNAEPSAAILSRIRRRRIRNSGASIFLLGLLVVGGLLFARTLSRPSTGFATPDMRDWKQSDLSFGGRQPEAVLRYPHDWIAHNDGTDRLAPAVVLSNRAEQLRQLRQRAVQGQPPFTWDLRSMAPSGVYVVIEKMTSDHAHAGLENTPLPLNPTQAPSFARSGTWWTGAVVHANRYFVVSIFVGPQAKTQDVQTAAFIVRSLEFR
jgi:hypothetical protein